MANRKIKTSEVKYKVAAIKSDEPKMEIKKTTKKGTEFMKGYNSMAEMQGKIQALVDVGLTPTDALECIFTLHAIEMTDNDIKDETKQKIF